MEVPERHFDWDYMYPDVSPVSSNPSYMAFKTHQSLENNLGVYTFPEFKNEDKDEFFIYGTCVSVRGEQTESRPEYIDETINGVPAHPESTLMNVEKSYESKINELHKQIKNLEEEANQIPVLQDNLRYLYEENVRLHQKNEVKESHQIQNGGQIDSTDDEVEEIVEEEVRTYKKTPKTDLVASELSNTNHFIESNSKVIDKSQFPSEYWSRLESYFYKRFLSDRPPSCDIGIQPSEASKRTAATMASPVNSSRFRCVGVSVCPSAHEVGVFCSKPETREFGCLFYETESVIDEWLDNVFPEMEDKYKKIVQRVIRSFYGNRSEFVSTLLSIIKKTVCHVGIQSQIISQPRGCSPIRNESEKVPNPNLVDHSPLSQVSEFVQALPVLNSRSTMTRRYSGVNVGCLTESPVLRSQGTSAKTDLRSFTTCGVQFENSVELVHRGCDAICPELRRIGSSTQTPLEWSETVTEVSSHLKDNVKSYRSTEFFEKTENFSNIPETDGLSSSVCVTRPLRDDSPKLSQTITLPPKSPLVTSTQSESYTVSTERRMVDELSQRYMVLDKVNLDELSSCGQNAFQEVASKSVDLGSTHIVKEFQPTVEVFHHMGDETEEVDPSTFPREVLSPFRINSPGIPVSTELINLKYDSRTHHDSSLSNPTTSDPLTSPPVIIPVIYGQTAKLPESVQKPPFPIVHTLVTPKPTSVSWIPVRNYRFILSNEAKKACESLIGYYQAERTVGRADEMKDKFLTVVRIWFELAASSQADLLSIEDFIAILHDYSPSLLRDVIQSVDENDSTCLHYSVGHGAWQVVNLILDTGHAHPDHCNQSGFSPIMIATLSNVNDSSALKTLSRLFTMGDVNLSTNTPARQSPLMLAALHGALDICSLLIAHGANINAQDASGNTALMYAIEQGHVSVIKCILGYGDLDLTLVDNNGKNALAVAKSKGDSEILNLIQSAYASTKGTSSTSEISPCIRYPTERRNTYRRLLELYGLHHMSMNKPVRLCL
ncbi:hypothetical protein MN116_002241 [Schistosoma mekongi]|uniref:Uncharacterized protein n=1 Tax=Schistosoma mekongi TaxID=38744 RepID=A0AAE1ZJP1_SCHME|nr:hypothetical protein MN116_002241 [Schistosoma mekongi]